MANVTVPAALLEALIERSLQLEVLAYEDKLTRLFNRTRLEMDLEDAESAQYAFGYGYIILDVDGLKEANDRLGHHAGDMLLRSVAEIIRAETDRSGDGAYRLGGDEFVVLVKNCCPRGIAAIIERIQALLEDKGLSASAGGGHSSEEGFMELADQRMYADKVKRKGAANIR